MTIKAYDLLLLLFNHSVVSDSLSPHGPQHARPPCPSPSPRVCSNSCLSSQWCHPTISSSVTPFSSCPQSFPASGSLPVSRLFVSGSQSIGASASASVLPMNIRDWCPLGWTGWISLQSKGLSRVFWKLLVAQSYPTLCDPMDCSQPDSSVHGDSPGKNNTRVNYHFLLQRNLPNWGIEPGSPSWLADSRVFSRTTVWKHQFFSAQPSSYN